MGQSRTIVIGTSHNQSFNIAGMDPGDIVKQARNKRKWSQADLAKAVRISQVAVKKIESGETLRSKHLPRIAQVLDIELSLIDQSLEPDPSGYLPRERVISPGRDFPVYAAAEGGPGEIIRSTDTVDWQPRPVPVANVRDAYGLYIVGISMAPEYRPGDIAIVNPHLPIIGDEVYIFYAEQEGEARATIKHLRRATPDNWLVSQHNPPQKANADFTMSRKEWRLAHRVVGKYSRA